MKGQVAAIFDIKNKILGNKKKPEREATAVINYRTRELEVCPEKIKEISLDYISNLLDNDEPEDDVKEDVALTNTIHVVRQLDRSEADTDDTINQDDIDEVFKKIKKKSNK